MKSVLQSVKVGVHVSRALVDPCQRRNQLESDKEFTVQQNEQCTDFAITLVYFELRRGAVDLSVKSCFAFALCVCQLIGARGISDYRVARGIADWKCRIAPYIVLCRTPGKSGFITPVALKEGLGPTAVGCEFVAHVVDEHIGTSTLLYID